ncbi:uncharacterized protein DNG_06456 [Cephalotrichum gorgonifer]|uniref:BTB domain-containing protein n=1 Tax=Cephalotrichum gorgonifer TaxID=2041049 RepID=A0AAE8N2I0_9PEZI|nr:uncharacterized protein DNG_06456 [Cephalotrichum gorgonifer]
MEEPHAELMKCLRRAYQDEEYSDLTIKCLGATYNVHKILVCPRSDFFAAACRWPSSTNDEQEGQRASDGYTPSGDAVSTQSGTKVINLDDNDPIAVWAMVQYLYHLEYPTPTDEMEENALGGWKQSDLSPPGGGQGRDSVKAWNIPSWTMPSNNQDLIPALDWRCIHRHAKIYSLAEKYGISGLKHFSSRRFKSSLDGHYHGDWVDVLACVREVYTGTPQHDRELRDEMRTALRVNMELVESEKMQELMLEIPQVAIDVLLDYHQHNRPNTAPKKSPKKRLKSECW